MQGDIASAALWVVILAAIVFGIAWLSSGRGTTGGRGGGVGPGASGAVYDFLNQDKRNALEIIVEEKAGARDPEDKDGNLPDLEDPGKRT